MKIDLCDRCLLYSDNPHNVCYVHPNGVTENHCLDFRQDPNCIEEKQCLPDGYSIYNGQLIPPPKYTLEQQWEILNTHPIFTGVCPQCKHEFEKNNRPQVHWDCPVCSWVDNWRLIASQLKSHRVCSQSLQQLLTG